MHPTLRAFKRHYHKVRQVVPRPSESGSFHCEIALDESSIRTKHSTPNEEDTVRFVVLMRRFLDPSDVLYYGKVWSRLQDDFAEVLSQKTFDSVESLTQQLNAGTIGIRINEQDLTAEQVYRTLADGVYFGRDEEAQRYLNSLAGIPVIGALFWNEFYTYTLTGFVLASRIFDAILEVEKSKTYKGLYEAPEFAKRCIYCLTTSGDFTSEEHIFPESLGNDELILPVGYVCDECNHRTLSALDTTLLEFDPIAFLRVQYVPYTKQGKLPKARFQNISMERTHPQHITIIAQDKSGLPQSKTELGDGRVSFNLPVRGKRFKPKVLARSLYKIGLGLVALSQGVIVACDSKYDHAREFITTGQGFPNSLLMCMNCVPVPEVVASHRDMSPGTPVAMSIYGLILLFNLETTPTVDLTDQLVQLHFELFPLDDQG
jgi:hypothetical protein